MKKRISVVFRSVPEKLVQEMRNHVGEYTKKSEYEKAAYVSRQWDRKFWEDNVYLSQINLVAELKNETIASASYLKELLKKKIGKKRRLLEICKVQCKKKNSIMELMVIS